MTVELQLDGDERVDAKTENSKATIPLLPEVVAALKEHRREMLVAGSTTSRRMRWSL